MTYFRDFTAHSWEFQVNFGGRIVPSKRAHVQEEEPASGSNSLPGV